MSPVFDKLNLKREREILVVNAPSTFEPELATLDGVVVLRDPGMAKAVHFALAMRQVAIDEDWSALRFRRAEYIKAHESGAPSTVRSKSREKN